MRYPIYTIGHSNHPETRFATFLERYEINVLLDVRSSPYSARAPQFNRSALTDWVRSLRVEYVFAGKSLGGRPDDVTLYDSGRASYERMAQTDAVLAGLRRLLTLARHSRVALMCAEAEPLECHRFLLIGRLLHQSGFDVRHILSNGSFEHHSEGEKRLIRLAGLVQPELFDHQMIDVLSNAYAAQEERVAFRRAVGGGGNHGR